MREGPFELKILLLNSTSNTGLESSGINDTIVAEECDINDQRYAKVEGGKAFAVQVIIHKTSKNGFWFKNIRECPPHLRIGLYVDGVDVQYWKRLDAKESSASTMSSIFWGFKDNQNTTSGLRTFNFALSKDNLGDNFNSSSSSSSSNTNNINGINNAQAKTVQNSISAGNVRVVLFEAEEVGGIYQNQVTHTEPLPDAPRLLKEGKKFWEQASVTTVAGESVDLNKEKFIPLTRWRNKSKEPLHAMTMFYHTHSTIRCLGNILSSSTGKKKMETSSGKRRKKPKVKDLEVKASKGDDDTVSLPDDDSHFDDSDDDDDDGRNDGGKKVAVVDLTSSDDRDSSVVIREQQIDEDISILVVKKNIPILDLTTD